MATDVLSTQEADEQLAARRAKSLSTDSSLLMLLMPLASLRLTVALFAMSIFLILAGTLAQVNQDIWEVMDQYFRAWFARIDMQIFFPPAFFPGGEAWYVPGWFYFPGGFLIGTAMGINLLAAHSLRFKVQARGPRLLAGLAVIALGALLTWIFVMGGSGKETIESATPLNWSALWIGMKWTLVVLWGVGAYALLQLDRSRTSERWLLIGFEVVLGGLLAFLFVFGDSATLGDSSMRILWQLIKGGLAALVLLAGCVLVFRKRAGIVLLHGGIMLVMANELVVYGLHVEGQMPITEGETVNFAQDVRTVELAVVDPSDPKTDDVVVVPEWMLKDQDRVAHDDLPFDVQTVAYLQNSNLEPPSPDTKNPATAGFGLQRMAVSRRAGSGTDVGGEVDATAAYVELFKKGTGEALGTYLVGIAVPPQKVDVDGKTYDLALRFKRTYKSYTIKLNDFRFDKYLGTMTPKNYSSDVHVVDKSRNVDRDVKIWMNNPLRFAGETFYQQSFFPAGDREGTVLQVVTNTGWMIPYVACMLVATGLLSQFSITLLRFLRRRNEAPSAPAGKADRQKRAVPQTNSLLDRYFPLALVTLAGVCVLAVAWPRAMPTTGMKLDEFGRLPVVYDGRVKPLDSVARDTLRHLSGKRSFKDEAGQRQPAIKWLLDTVAKPGGEARKHKIIRIENIDVLETLGLHRREGLRYSIDEFGGKFEELDRQVQQAAKLDPAKLSIYQKKLLELAQKLRTILRFEMAFEKPPLRAEHAKEDLVAAVHHLDVLAQMQLPLVVPPDDDQTEWDNFASAWFDGLKDRVQGNEPNPATLAMTGLLAAYDQGDAKTFNADLAVYQNWLSENSPADYDESKVSFEAFYNALAPLFWACSLYIVAFVLAALGWLGWTAPLNRAAYGMILLALALHTFALLARIYISGRPPVTNLYSSAVFIGWGGVVLGLALERIYRLGIGTVVASIAGFGALAIAVFGLDDGTDTLGVMQAVLDTQFWLATHVVCVTLGYTTTFVAGLLALLYIVRGVLTRSLTPAVGKDLSRMIYGTLCFALFFSFIGTVLGGLWADDSWGRFWGWDPKENGALMIVLWNALVLHARWGGMVKDRGLAALAIGGNIITGWSWFGVNELGIGLHSYGFTEGVLLLLSVFVLSQLALISMALLPKDRWLSFRVNGS